MNIVIAVCVGFVFGKVITAARTKAIYKWFTTSH